MKQKNTIEVYVKRRPGEFVPKCNVYLRPYTNHSAAPLLLLEDVSWSRMPEFLDTFCHAHKANIAVYCEEAGD